MMKHGFLVFLIVVATFGCMQRPAPVAETETVAPADRPAIGVEYVQVPAMQVYERPAIDAPVTGSYGLSEAISILEVKGEWKMVRTFEGTGWVKSIDLATGEQLSKIDLTEPRFYVAPVQVPATTRGELAYEAKVNTDGAVVEVKLTKNTTGNQAIADANAEALAKAMFYPMVDKGQRKVFTYQHHVYY